MTMIASLVMALACQTGIPAQADGTTEIHYPPSSEPGALQFGVTYTFWIPPGVQKLRGLIVHQHGCGSGACKGGKTAAYDLHWQALARKWDCALLGPSYEQEDKQDCSLWCDPRKGSEKAFLKAIKEAAERSMHPELETVPWCLWGHSGGGTWASIMQVLHPERIVAIWLRSGTAFHQLEKGEPLRPELAALVYSVPVMCNPGAKENGDKRFNGAWTGTLEMFRAYRARGAPIGFAPDPRTSHECGDSRYLAIPFFDACLSMRLPRAGETALRPVDPKAAWLAEPLSDAAQPVATYPGKSEEAVWLPDAAVAKAWSEYVKTGTVGDQTPPPPATRVHCDRKGGKAVLTWEAEADFESGIRAFVIVRDGKDLAQVPEKPVGKFGRPLFQTMSYHDTPEPNAPAMRYEDPSAAEDAHEYRIVVVNGAGLRSEPSTPVVLPPAKR
jgi:Esterase PHB depolymerase